MIQLPPDAGNHHDPMKLITISELADLLRISERSVWRLVSSGQMLKPLRIGGSVRWRLADVHRWLQDGCPPSDRKAN